MEFHTVSKLDNIFFSTQITKLSLIGHFGHILLRNASYNSASPPFMQQFPMYSKLFIGTVFGKRLFLQYIISIFGF